MLTLHRASNPYPIHQPRVGLALAGGGPVGAIFELGALRALDESIDGLRMHELDVYVGVSAGGVIAASLANGISTAEMCRIFLGHEHAQHAFEPEKLLQPAYGEYLRRAKAVPGIISDSLINLIRDPAHASVSRFIGALGKAVPSGIFDNEAVHEFLLDIFESSHCTNDFRKLKRPLYVVAVDLDSGVAVRFGGKDFDDIPISRAVQASAALPGMYPPVKIGDRYFVDGALRRTMHASVALDEGVDLVFGVNPLVPYDSTSTDSDLTIPVRKLIQGGLPLILSQTFRAMIQSRMNVALEKYSRTHPGADIVLVQPHRGDEAIFFTNIFSFASRRALCDHAYRRTRANLRQKADLIEPCLNRHGLSLNRARLEDPDRSLLDSLNDSWFASTNTSRTLSQALDDLEWALSRRAAG
jgi:predicted acylesterase/phospholipase RssA